MGNICGLGRLKHRSLNMLSGLIAAGREKVEGLRRTSAGATAFTRYFGWRQIRLVAFVNPKVLVNDDERTEVVIPLNWVTRNHLDAMYFGVLMTGADLAGGLTAMQQIRSSGKRVDLLFKDAAAKFHKRVEGDCHFHCDDGRAVAAAVDEAITTKKRVNLPLRIRALVPDRLSEEVAAEFTLTLSLKYRP